MMRQTHKKVKTEKNRRTDTLNDHMRLFCVRYEIRMHVIIHQQIRNINHVRTKVIVLMRKEKSGERAAGEAKA